MIKPVRLRKFLIVLVFINGAAVTALEITASRILAPYFGTSLPVWGSVIGITLGALALGYSLGGRLADRKPDLASLSGLMITAGILTLLIPFFDQPVLVFITRIMVESNLLVTIGSLFASIIIFALPLMIMGMISPYGVKLGASNISKVGSISGSLYSWATIGSLVGVFASAFWLVPFYGSKQTILIWGLLECLVAGTIIAKKYLWLVFLMIISALGLSLSSHSPKLKNTLVEKESSYQWIRVIESKNIRELLINEGTGIQSIYDSKRQLLINRYWDYSVLLPYLQPEKKQQKMLIIGAAGATAATNIKDHVKDFNLDITGVEIDPAVVSLAKEYFFADSKTLKYIMADGRVALNQLKDKYDIIMIDAYTQQHYIPPHLVTAEFFTDLKQHLTDDGFIIANVNAADSGSKLLLSIGTTLKSVWPNIWQISIPKTYNFYFIASQKSNLWQNFSPPAQFSQLTKVFTDDRKDFDGQGLLLTDDRAPVEFLTDADIIQTYLQEAK